MKKLSDDEKAELQAKIEQARTERIQFITESLSDSPISSDAENIPVGDGRAKQTQIQKTQAKSVIERFGIYLVIVLVGGALFALIDVVIDLLISTRLLLLLGGVSSIFAGGALARGIVVNILKSLKNRESECAKSDTKSLTKQIGGILLCVGLCIGGIFMIIEWHSDLNSAWEGIVVDKWIDSESRICHVAVEYEGKRHERMVAWYPWVSLEVGDKLIKKKGSPILQVVHTHRK